MLVWPPKDPDEVLDYQVDWSARLGTGDTIATSTWDIPTGITAASDSNDTTTATIWLSGGSSGSVYVLTNTITTTIGRTFEQQVRLAVNGASQFLVSLADVKQALRIDTSDDDLWLTALIAGASRSVLNYLKSGADIFKDEEGVIEPASIPDEVKISTIMMVGYLFRNPDNDTEKAFEPGYLPAPVVSMLYPLRDPALA